jgi:hypothetical protein
MGFYLAHDPPKCERFGDKVMRSFSILERGRWASQVVCPTVTLDRILERHATADEIVKRPLPFG